MNLPQFAGAAVVPMNPLPTEREVGFYLSDAGMRVVFAFEQPPDGGGAARAAGEAGGVEVAVLGAYGLSAEQFGTVDPVAEPEPREDSDLARLLYTSGTT
jgi:long-chain acyl-CoA synthetase